MHSFDEGFARLEDAMGRIPLEFPVGFFLQDNAYPGAPGGFLWYKTDKEVLNAIRNDLFSVFDREEDIDEIRSRFSGILADVEDKQKLSEALRKRLDDYLAEAGTNMEFIATFKRVCEGSGDWESEVRQQFRESTIDDLEDDDAEDMSDDELKRPITSEELSEFAEFIMMGNPPAMPGWQ